MQRLESDTAPQVRESLGKYALRLRERLGLSQKEVAEIAGIHAQSYGKIERDRTDSLNHKTKQGLSSALKIPSDYLDAVCRGMVMTTNQGIRFCPKCWQSGTLPDSLWLHSRAKYCYECGTQLRERCVSCNEQITSFKHRFCPYCGTPYQIPHLLPNEKR
ncbi:zinc ribbon domain-containing protein [Acaryochloris sp. IP29b_bin.137]|uniref:double zinc ribbon domain-containing protein n=1 Tax=Acaryochloris sp. IP29b_bin.137 TaxID=2969217 RepID=UPI00262C2FF0|nr:zinc ribbon domain-containing protein [Acaryochloris sp. IP29b_bin.137]